MSNGQELAVVLDIGSARVRMLIGTFNEGEPQVEVIGGHSVPSSGIRAAGIYNHEDVQRCVMECVTLLEEGYGASVHEVIVSISGERLRFRRQAYRLKVGDPAQGKKEITVRQDHIQRLYQRIQDQFIEPDYDVLHYHEQLFSLDEGGQVKNPVGLSSIVLAGNLVGQFYPATALANVRRVVERSGLIVRAVVSAGLASALAVLNEDELDLGVLLLDIGAEMTDIIAFQHGQVQYAGNLAQGAHRITRDIAAALRVDMTTAEQIKLSFGGLQTTTGEDKRIEYTDFRNTVSTIGTSEVRQIVQPRVEEILQQLHQLVEENLLIGGLGGGIVLTGGGSCLEGLPELVSQLFGKPARHGRPLNYSGGSDKYSCADATALGMLRWQTDPGRYQLYQRDPHRLARWVRGLQKRTIKKMDRIFN
ncbi:MAG: cell division protein FtsA [Candidatus Delongbacteria bacterium]|nr:cell division protein FtsA [Candidatus Delongbacteria bacterium]